MKEVKIKPLTFGFYAKSLAVKLSPPGAPKIFSV